MWEDSDFVVRQLEGIGQKYSEQLAQGGLKSFTQLMKASSATIEHLTSRRPPYGSVLQEQLTQVPCIELEVHAPELQNMLSITLVQTSPCFRPSHKQSSCVVLVAGRNATEVLFRRRIKLDSGHCSKNFSLHVPDLHTAGAVSVRAIHESLVGVDVKTKLFDGRDFSSESSIPSSNEKSGGKRARRSKLSKSSSSLTKKSKQSSPGSNIDPSGATPEAISQRKPISGVSWQQISTGPDSYRFPSTPGCKRLQADPVPAQIEPTKESAVDLQRVASFDEFRFQPSMCTTDRTSRISPNQQPAGTQAPPSYDFQMRYPAISNAGSGQANTGLGAQRHTRPLLQSPPNMAPNSTCAVNQGLPVQEEMNRRDSTIEHEMKSSILYEQAFESIF